jgi:hypothetical protein
MKHSIDRYLSCFEERAGVDRDWCARLSSNVPSSSPRKPQTLLGLLSAALTAGAVENPRATTWLFHPILRHAESEFLSDRS